MGGAHDAPLGAHLVEAAQEELAQATPLLDLAEHGLGQLLSEAIGAVVARDNQMLWGMRRGNCIARQTSADY